MRSTKCTLKFATAAKREKLRLILAEYGRVVNCFIDQFWKKCPKKYELLKAIVNSVETWLSFAMRQTAAREAIDMLGAKESADKKLREFKPKHCGKAVRLFSTVASMSASCSAKSFDGWLSLKTIGSNIKFSVPIKLHKHYLKLAKRGTICKSYVISEKCVQLCFEIETGEKKEIIKAVGVDTGINNLAALSNGKLLGRDIKAKIERIKRCKHGSKGQKRAVRCLRQLMDIIAKKVVKEGELVVAEKLKNITKNTKYAKSGKLKRRLSKNMRRSIGSWNVRYWLNRLQSATEDNRVTFRSVLAFNTSRTCPSCGHVDWRNREGQKFLCQNCGHAGHADVEAAKNILSRFLTGPYSAGCVPKTSVVEVLGARSKFSSVILSIGSGPQRDAPI